MTVQTTLNLVTYTGDGVATTFPFTFPVYDADHVKVYTRLIATRVLALVSDSDYSVTGVGNANGGSVVMDVAPAGTYQLVVARIVPLTQDLDVDNQGGFYPENFEAELDLLEMQLQQHDEAIGRSVRGPLGEIWPEIGTSIERVGGLLGFTDDANAYPTVLDSEAVGALLASVLGAGTGISVGYAGGVITITNTAPNTDQDCWLLESGVGGGGSGDSAELIRDTIFAALIGVGCTITQDDPGNTITITVAGGGGVTLEQVYDAISSSLVSSTGLIEVDSDIGDTTTISVDPEFIRDTIGTALVGGLGITSTVDDGGDTITLAISPDIQSVVSAATITPTFADNQVNVTALAVPATIANPTGTAIDGHGILIRIKDNGVSRALTFGAKYRVFANVLPTATTASKTHYIGVVYNLTDDKWDVLGVRVQA